MKNSVTRLLLTHHPYTHHPPHARPGGTGHGNTSSAVPPRARPREEILLIPAAHTARRPHRLVRRGGGQAHSLEWIAERVAALTSRGVTNWLRRSSRPVSRSGPLTEPPRSVEGRFCRGVLGEAGDATVGTAPTPTRPATGSLGLRQRPASQCRDV